MANRFADMFVAGALKVPEKIYKKDTFKASRLFSAPRNLNLEGYCTPVENQGNLPYCAAYSASSFAENILWRKRGFGLQPKGNSTAYGRRRHRCAGGYRRLLYAGRLSAHPDQRHAVHQALHHHRYHRRARPGL